MVNRTFRSFDHLTTSPGSTSRLPNLNSTEMFDGKPKQLQNKNQAPPTQVCQVRVFVEIPNTLIAD